MKWQIKGFGELTPMEVYEALKLRVDVFVVEQNCPYPELDNKDIHPETRHLLGRDGDGRLAAYLRILPRGLSFEEVSIGRVAVAMDHRDRGIAHEMMPLALSAINRTWPGAPVKIGAQLYLKSFYERYGFVPVSNDYLEDGIPHIDMLRTPPK